jgi:catechol 2,3-dioxygenase-like lactoylglutathione lyase family enzyme
MENFTSAFSSYSITNVEESKTFYQDVLGLKISEPMGQLQLELPGGLKVFLYQKDHHQAASFTVLNFQVEHIRELMEQLRSKGVRFEVYTEQEIKTDDLGLREDDGMKIAWFKDPSGNILSLIQNT